jgi:CRP-like cAMP-binding protein
MDCNLFLINGVALFKLVLKVGPQGMAGEMGVILGTPQPFTVRSRRLTQVVRIGRSHLLQILRPNTADADTVHANFVQYLRSLKEHVAADATFFGEILSEAGLVSTHKKVLK